MRKSRFTDQQIIAILAEQEWGLATAEVCRRHGISQGTFYKWKAKYAMPCHLASLVEAVEMFKSAQALGYVLVPAGCGPMSWS